MYLVHKLLGACVYASLLGLFSTVALAQQTHADLSVSAVATPAYFVPGERNTIALTVNNYGPDHIDNGVDYSVSAVGDYYNITFEPPPYDIYADEAVGCWAERFIVELVPPNNGTMILFSYNFGSLRSGESRTCIYDVQFAPTTTPPFTFSWRVRAYYSNMNDDPNPLNDIFTYTLSAAPPASPTSLPIGSLGLWIFLGIGLAALAFSRRRSTNT